MTDARLFVPDDLRAGGMIALGRDQAHYLGRVLRLGSGEAVRLFNGRDGEWRGRIVNSGKNAASLTLETELRPFRAGPDLWLLFAPLKRGPTDLVVQKATELGVSRIVPVMTARTVAERVNPERLRSTALEAAEQSERLDIPETADPIPIKQLAADWPRDRRLLICDESGAGAPVAPVLAQAGRGPWALLLGPEGGFAPGELDAFAELPFVFRVGLGPRILRAETAALAALAVWQALLGDWADPPPRRGSTPDR